MMGHPPPSRLLCARHPHPQVPRTAEDVLALSGGGDWHMAYLLLYKAVRVPAAADAK